jgi:ABC-2 type transport system permease protein
MTGMLAQRLRWRARQSLGIFRIYIQDGLAYRAQGLIWVLTDVTTAVIMPQVWLAAGKGASIQGYTPGQMILYYLCVILLKSFIVSHFMWDISHEIKEGIFSSQIIRPMPYLQFMVTRNFAWRLIRTGIFFPFFVGFACLYWGQIQGSHLYVGWEFWLSLILGHLVSIAIVTALAMIALFTEEAQSIFELYYVPAMFLGGELFPVALMPVWVQSIAHWAPFYYTAAAPTEILIGKVEPAAAGPVLLAQLAWILVGVALFGVLFRAGTKRYSGVGM